MWWWYTEVEDWIVTVDGAFPTSPLQLQQRRKEVQEFPRVTVLEGVAVRSEADNDDRQQRQHRVEVVANTRLPSHHTH